MASTIEIHHPEFSQPRIETQPTSRTRTGAWLRRLLTRQYLPWAERYLHWLRHPLTLLLLADIACGVCGAVLHPNGFLLLAAVSSMIVLGLVWPWLSLCGIVGVVSFRAHRGREREACDVVLSLSNRCPWPAWGLSLEGLLSRDVTAALDVVPGWRQSEYAWQLRPTRRGIYPRSTPMLTTSFPFGLWEARRAIPSANQITIWPAAFGTGPLGRVHGDESFDGGVSILRPGTGGDLLGARPYRRGDSLRRIHWAKSAQLDRLVTCERERCVRPRAQLVLDTHRDSQAAGDDEQEWAVRLAAGAGCALIDQGAEVTAVLAGRVVRLSGADPRRTILDLLAQIECDECPPLDELLTLSQVRRFNGDRQIIVTSASARDRLPPDARGDRRRCYLVLDGDGPSGQRRHGSVGPGGHRGLGFSAR